METLRRAARYFARDEKTTWRRDPAGHRAQRTCRVLQVSISAAVCGLPVRRPSGPPASKRHHGRGGIRECRPVNGAGMRYAPCVQPPAMETTVSTSSD